MSSINCVLLNNSIGDISGFTNLTYDSIGDYIQYCVDNGFLPDINIIPLVPKMTSATTPSGVVTSSGNDSNNPSWLPYKAFNEDIIEGWWSNIGTNSYISYQSVRPICVKKISVQSVFEGNTIRLKNFKLQGSNNGSNWTDIYTGVYKNNDNLQKFSFANDNFYSYHRLYCIDTYATSTGFSIVIKNLQFYGQTS